MSDVRPNPGSAPTSPSAIDVAAVTPLTTDERVALARVEGERWLSILRAATPPDWDGPSGCAGWTLADLARHLLGQARAIRSFAALAAQMRAGKRLARGRPLVDGITEHQVASTAHLSADDLVALLASELPRAAAARGRWPRTSTRLGPTVEVPRPDGSIGRERWTLAYAAQVYTRDLWMHRADLARATRTPMLLTPEHDGRLVADVVRDWAVRHGGPFHLRLAGPAGGHWRSGDGGPEVERDAVDFANGLFGRSEPPPYGVVVPF
jgi:uncharacterized protein (TIGR03083 family)